MVQTLTRYKSVIFGAVLILVLVIVSVVLPDHWTLVLTRVLIMALFAMSLNIQTGYAGMMPLGHAMFLGLGGYTFGLLVINAAIPLAPAFFISLIICMVINAIIGFICLRGKGMAFGLLHLAFNIFTSTLVAKWISLTGGSNGIVGVPRPELFADTQSFFYFALVTVAICFIIIRILLNSPYAKIAQGLRENEERLSFLGINVNRFKLVTFIISGAFAGIAGMLLSMLDKGAYPNNVSLLLSVEGFMMCLIGGMGTFMGPSIGAAIVVIVSVVFSNFVSQWQGVLGVIIIVCVLAFRGGILGKRSKLKLLPKGTIK